MKHPYEDLPPEAYWRTAIAERPLPGLEKIYVPRFGIDSSTRIAAAGSCFAQHIGRQFKERGYNFVDLEPPPPLLAASRHGEFGFGLYSARYGNVYSIRQLLQLFLRARGSFRTTEPAWEKDGRFHDPFRPSIEPRGFASREELEIDRQYHLGRVDKLLAGVDVFIFTFGLTEAWVVREDGAVLPTCPGTVAGRFDPGRHAFRNFGFGEILQDAEDFIRLASAVRADIKFLLTVSPVPLTATASGSHVLSATVYSKSVLRAVCGTLCEKYPQVDYFPSYELIASHPMRAMAFEENMRSVSAEGVRTVMDAFFAAQEGVVGEGGARPAGATPPDASPQQPGAERDSDDARCDEIILETFAR